MERPAATNAPATARNLAKDFVTTTRNTLLFVETRDRPDVRFLDMASEKAIRCYCWRWSEPPAVLRVMTYAVMFRSGNPVIKITR